MDIEKFIQDGFRKVNEESKAFEDEFNRTKQSLENFREQMDNKKWQLLRNCDSQNERL
ncbi:hypothetical protein [Brevibacillus porteri]|uniref:hypothetical protein n=1 Tax=Brevibacillus porteri TaxID=2126350 RepID=UPI003D1B47AB